MPPLISPPRISQKASSVLLNFLRFVMHALVLTNLVVLAYEVMFGLSLYVYPGSGMTVDSIPYYDSFPADVKSKIYVGGFDYWFIMWSDLLRVAYTVVAWWLLSRTNVREAYAIHAVIVLLLGLFDFGKVMWRLVQVWPNCKDYWYCATPGVPVPNAQGTGIQASFVFMMTTLVGAAFCAQAIVQLCLTAAIYKAQTGVSKMQSIINGDLEYPFSELLLTRKQRELRRSGELATASSATTTTDLLPVQSKISSGSGGSSRSLIVGAKSAAMPAASAHVTPRGSKSTASAAAAAVVASSRSSNKIPKDRVPILGERGHYDGADSNDGSGSDEYY
jgi:hypothetical protein